jgi:phosphoribosylformylglycinamidine synthase
MGADVVGVLDPLRFGDPQGPNARQVISIARGVVDGIAQYGNPLGVPNLGGDIAFDPGFDENCLVNVVAIGTMRESRVLRSRVPAEAADTPYKIILIGKPTDDSGKRTGERSRYPTRFSSGCWPLRTGRSSIWPRSSA